MTSDEQKPQNHAAVELFLTLTWDQLIEWAGEKVVARGGSYKKHIEDLRVTPGGRLIAWVHGTETYATTTAITEQGSLIFQCTCPYSWGPCKHAVSLILAYTDAIKNRIEIPLAQPDDERLTLLDLTKPQDLDSVLATTATTDHDIPTYLKSLPKETLINMILEIAYRDTAIHQKLHDQAQLHTLEPAELIAWTRKQILQITREKAYWNYWNHQGHLPDYTPVREGLQALLILGLADEVLSLGQDLIERGFKQIEESDDEGETRQEIGETLGIVLQGVAHSSLPRPAQLLWVIETFLKDDWGILNDYQFHIENGQYTNTDWNEVADEFLKRLPKVPKFGDDAASFIAANKRRGIMQWAITALERAGREKEITPLLVREAPITTCYIELVERLIVEKNHEEARWWAMEGIESTTKNKPSIASTLEQKLATIAEQEENWPLVASYHLYDFYELPSLTAYERLRQHSERAQAWPTIREAALQFLETGEQPGIKTKNLMEHDQQSSSNAWPLPQTGLEYLTRKQKLRFPVLDTLIDIAIAEGRNDDVHKWYLQSKTANDQWYGQRDTAVADTLQDTHPQLALSIWKTHAELLIDQTNPNAYREAGHLLRKVRTLLIKRNQTEEWNSYTANLQTIHKRRKRFIEILNQLEGKKISE